VTLKGKQSLLCRFAYNRVKPAISALPVLF